MSRPAVKPKIATLNFVLLFIATAMMFFSLDFLIPVLPFYVVGAGGNEGAVGLLMGLFVFCSVVLRPFQGRAVDRTGRKRLLLAGIGAYALAGAGLVAMPSLAMLFVVRALQGFGWGAFLLAFNTMAVDLAPPERMGEAVGLIGMAPTLSMLLAPLLGEFAKAQGSGYRLLFVVSLAFILAALVAAAPIKEPPPEKSVADRLSLFSRKMLLPSLMIFFLTINFGVIITFIPLLAETRGIAAAGPYFTVFALTALFARPLSGRLSDRLGRAQVFVPGLTVLALALTAIAIAESSIILLLGAFLFGCGMGSAHPAILALTADRLATGERGVGMATFTAAFDSGIVAGAVVPGLLLARIGFLQLFLLCAVVALLPVAVYAASRAGRGRDF